MSMINLTKVEVIDNPTNFFNPIQLEIEFEAVCDLLEGPSSVLLLLLSRTSSQQKAERN